MNELEPNPNVALNNARSDSFYTRVANFVTPVVRSSHTDKLDAKSRETAIRMLDALKAGDSEVAHSAADDILLSFLTDLNETDVVNAYLSAKERIRFWYA